MQATKITCSLCYQNIASTELRAHREEETREMIGYTLDMIKARHPDWSENDPTCQLCWDYYKNIPIKQTIS